MDEIVEILQKTQRSVPVLIDDVLFLRKEYVAAVSGRLPRRWAHIPRHKIAKMGAERADDLLHAAEAMKSAAEAISARFGRVAPSARHNKAQNKTRTPAKCGK